MLGSFYTLRALARAWHERLTGAVLGDAFSQEAGELVLAFEKSEAEAGDDAAMQSVRIGVERPLLFVFRTVGASKARSNVATLFEAAHGRRVEAVRIARRDRQLFFELEGEGYLQVPLFGARANVLLVEKEGEAARVVEAFRGHEKHAGQPPPAPQAAPMPDDFAAFEARWRDGRNTLKQAVSSAFTLFGPTLAAEAVHRAGVETGDPAGCTEAERRALFDAGQALREEVRTPAPRLYTEGRGEGWGGGTFALIELHHRRGDEAEAFATVDEAVRVHVRRRLAARRHDELSAPLEDALTRARDRQQRTIQSLEGQLAGTPRADRYERFGHLLKAQGHQVTPGAEEVTLADYFAEEAGEDGPPTVRVPLQPELTAMENADRYYEKAKDARTARAKAEERLVQARREERRTQRLLDELHDADTLKKLRRFRRERADALAAYAEDDDGTGDSEASFRRFRLKGGYQILAGKNARQNHDLTFHHAQPYDLWLHARQVPGAHVVLRLPSRDAEPDPRVVQAAADVAAHYSKARSSGLVPVMVTRRKYVTSPSGAPPGAVRVEREEVVMAAPRLPGG